MEYSGVQLKSYQRVNRCYFTSLMTLDADELHRIIVCKSQFPINLSSTALKDTFILNNNASLSSISKDAKILTIINNQSSISSFNLQDYSLSQLQAIYIGYQCFNNSCSQVIFKSNELQISQ